MSNSLKTLLLLSSLTALLGVLGQAVGGTGGLLLALAVAGAMNAGAFWFSDRLVLRMQGARPVRAGEAPELEEELERLARRAGVPTPALYIMDVDLPNAFATGRSPRRAAVAVTRGLLESLSPREVRGVLAHELAHVKHRDTLTMTVAATLGGAIGVLADMMMFGAASRDGEDSNPVGALAAALVAPLAAVLIQAAVSRSREFEADAAAARMTNDPMALASALQRIESLGKARSASAAGAAAAHLFIVNPFRGASLSKLFGTHPPTRERVARLKRMTALVEAF